MRFLFRKRIRLFPGISINLSKSEVGTSFATNHSSIIKGGGLRKAVVDSVRPDSRTVVSAPYPGWSMIVPLRGWVLLLLVTLGGIGLLV